MRAPRPHRTSIKVIHSAILARLGPKYLSITLHLLSTIIILLMRGARLLQEQILDMHLTEPGRSVPSVPIASSAMFSSICRMAGVISVAPRYQIVSNAPLTRSVPSVPRDST